MLTTVAIFTKHSVRSYAKFLETRRGSVYEHVLAVWQNLPHYVFCTGSTSEHHRMIVPSFIIVYDLEKHTLQRKFCVFRVLYYSWNRGRSLKPYFEVCM